MARHRVLTARSVSPRPAWLVLAMLALVAAACGGDATESDGADDATEDESGAEEESAPEELTSIEFLLNFGAYPADHSYFTFGIQDGIYEQHGLDVTLVEGTGSGDALAALGAGQFHLALLDTGTLMLGIANNDVPVTNLGVINQQSPMSIIFMADAGYETVEDLRGMTIASSQGGSMTRLFPGLLAANNMTENDVSMAFVGSGESQQVVMLNGQADAFLGYYPDDGMTLRLEGHDVDWIPFADSGVNLLNLGVGANLDWLEQNRDTAEAFMRATQESIEGVLDDPQAAAESFVDQFPDAGYDPEGAVAMLETSFELLKTEASEDLQYGHAAEEDWRRAEELLTEYMELEPADDLSRYYTTDFVE